MARVAILIGIIAFVFVGVLPRLVDYDAVRAALASLTTAQLTVFVAATGIAYVANAGPCRVLVDGLSWPHAVGSDLAARAVVSTIPGPTDIATKYVLYRQWEIPAETATAGIVFAAFFEPLSALVLPLIAVIGVIVTGHTTRPNVIWVAAIGLAIFIVAALLLVGIVRSESLARRFGNGLDWLARHLWTLVRKDATHRDRPGGPRRPRPIEGHPVAARRPRVRGGRGGEAGVVPRARGGVVGRGHHAR